MNLNFDLADCSLEELEALFDQVIHALVLKRYRMAMAETLAKERHPSRIASLQVVRDSDDQAG